MRPQSATAVFLSGCRSGIAWCSKRIGPGVVTGAADDDPSGIATYAIAGASLGYGLLWVALITAPMMIVVQEMCARIAMVSGQGLASGMRRVMPLWLLRALVFLVVAANTLNIAADIAGMSSAADLVTHVPSGAWAVGLGALLIVVEVFASYKLFAAVVKWLCLTLFAYVVAAFVVGVDWLAALRHTLIPEIRFERMWLATFVGFLGTTITPYLFFWQAALEVEEERAIGRTTVARRRGATEAEIRASRADVTTGMIFSNAVSWFIVLTTATTLYAHHVRIQSVRDAAEALRPLAGDGAYWLFALGVLGAGLLAVPVLAGSSAYALAETFRWKSAGLDAKPSSARSFYTVIVLGIAFGVVADLFGVDAVGMLFWSAVVNGFVAVPLLIGIALAGNHREMMGRWKNGRASNAWIVVTILLMGAAAIGLVVTA
ncbi:MAG TPA: Nramp family divalent metal transporter [Candidatus Elarobacter sp.]|nr:Nramp family divalent metal transporter [Candidatus Elarobacter sp.]